jgi:hypothetical protein
LICLVALSSCVAGTLVATRSGSCFLRMHEILTVSGLSTLLPGSFLLHGACISKDFAQTLYDAKMPGGLLLRLLVVCWGFEVTQSYNRHYSQFFRRHNPNTTIDSICTVCYLTVATADNERELHAKEVGHRCSERVTDLLPRVDKRSTA